MKKLLLTGGSHAEIPLIQAAHKQGWYVITTGNNTDGLGHMIADKYVQGDFSDKEFVYELAKKEEVDAIVSGCNDFAYLSTAYACQRLNLPGHDSYETATTIHHKDKFRQLLRELKINTPQAIKCAMESDVQNACNTMGFPVVVKPVDLTGGKGVEICQTIEEALHAFQCAQELTREPAVIVEEFIEGNNYGITTLLKNQKVIWYLSGNEEYYINKYLVSGAYAPSDVYEYSLIELIHQIEKIAEHLMLSDGLFHAQFIVTHDGKPYIIDPCRRSPGDLYILFAKYATGVDYPEAIIKSETGQRLNDHYTCDRKFVARECIMTDVGGIYDHIFIDETIRPLIREQMIWAKSGDMIDDIMKFKAGILILEFSSYEKMRRMLEKMNTLVYIIRRSK